MLLFIVELIMSHKELLSQPLLFIALVEEPADHSQRTQAHEDQEGYGPRWEYAVGVRGGRVWGWKLLCESVET